ncbi:MAG: molybdopterin molybdotransferase MoeA [Candidatus Adiutrix sp.]|jgi:molybdopterin molybdotransferase/putative molybdopterin biosynthesis protein|nr:molybdopterin molybdotransferase MoeA [Candidatus Adiutrix sp.]
MTEYKRKSKAYYDPEKLITRAETLERLREHWRPRPGRETVPLSQAAGRVCAEELASHNTQPLVRASMADGIAVRSADFENGPPDTSNWREGRDYVPADMGDDFDDAFDMVINIEKVSFDSNGVIHLEAEEEARSGLRVKPSGDTLRLGESVMAAGLLINPFQVGLLAGAGINEVPVTARPRVAYIPTGDELVPPGRPLERGRTVESNGLMVAATLEAWQADQRPLPIVADQKAALASALDEALAASDLVLINGGSSMGSEDHVSGLLARRGTFFQHGVRAIPGMPMAVAIVDGKPVINIPGPPFAAFCGLDWCLKPLIAHWYGRPCPQRRTVPAKLTKPLRKPEQFEFFSRLHLFRDLNLKYQAEPIRFDERYAEAARRFNAIIILPIGCDRIEAGEEIEAEILYTEH